MDRATSMTSFLMGNPTAQTPVEPAIAGVRITISVKCTCNLTYNVCDRWNLATDLVM